MPNYPYGQEIHDRLYSYIKNEYGVAGVMGNMYAESMLIPFRVQGDMGYPNYTYSRTYTNQVNNGSISQYAFVHNGPNGGGYGLCQWTYYTRKQNLYNLMRSMGVSIGSVNLQVAFLIQELENGYSGLLDTLKNATDIRTPTVAFLLQFERPANQSVAVQNQRTQYAQQMYDLYAGTSGEIVCDFVPRLNSNGMQGNPYWYSENPFWQSGFGLPNCTAYAWGRAYEIIGDRPNLSVGNANQWWDYNLNNSIYESGQTPQLGAIACYYYNPGGHVAVVEQINSDGSIVISQSGYSSRIYFWLDTAYASNDYKPSWLSGAFQGFIYLPGSCHVITPTPPTPDIPFVSSKTSKWIYYLPLLG